MAGWGKTATNEIGKYFSRCLKTEEQPVYSTA